MKIITASLSGAALDWAVAKCEGIKDEHWDEETKCFRDDWDAAFHPSEDWSQGGPIISDEKISVSSTFMPPMWVAFGNDTIGYYGETPLIAAMKCYVSLKLGSEVEIPEELA